MESPNPAAPRLFRSLRLRLAAVNALVFVGIATLFLAAVPQQAIPAGAREVAVEWSVRLALLGAGVLVVGIVSWLACDRLLAGLRQVRREAESLPLRRLTKGIDTRVGVTEIEGLVASINSLLVRVEGGFLAQERFLAVAAHELQTPLAVLLARAQVLGRRRRSRTEYEHFVSSVERDVRELASTVNAVLTLTRSKAGDGEELSDRVSLNDVTAESVKRNERSAERRQMRLVSRLLLPDANHPEPVLRGNEGLLCTLVGNLVRNALQHSGRGGTVEVVLSADRTHATITVRDAGPGIPVEFREAVFEPLFRVRDGTRREPGLGLGLTIANDIARLHGGSITLSCPPTGGCEFVVRLPLEAANHGAKGSAKG